MSRFRTARRADFESRALRAVRTALNAGSLPLKVVLSKPIGERRARQWLSKGCSYFPRYHPPSRNLCITRHASRTVSVRSKGGSRRLFGEFLRGGVPPG